jgi:hypothetical protein
VIFGTNGDTDDRPECIGLRFYDASPGGPEHLQYLHGTELSGTGIEGTGTSVSVPRQTPIEIMA